MVADKKAFGTTCTNVTKNSENMAYANINYQKEVAFPSLLLHSCCGPCSTAVIENLIDDYNITIFFYNPNITDNKEYQRRKEAQLTVIENFNSSTNHKNKVNFVEGRFEPNKFFEVAKGLEGEKEGGRRCYNCFRLRLEETALFARLNNFDTFTTTLTVSPHKSYDVISSIGKKLAVKYGISYLDGNFKKKDGFKRSVELSKKFGIYRQNYCGCEFSDWRKEK